MAVAASAGIALLGIAPAAHAAPGDPIAMPDDALRECVNDDLAQGAADPITEAQAQSVTGLSCTHNDYGAITDLTGLEEFTGLQFAVLVGSHDPSATPAVDDQIVDISPLAGLPGLLSLTLDKHGIVDTSAFTSPGFPELRSLNLRRNPGLDHSNISALTELGYLNLDSTGPLDTGVLTNLTALTDLHISDVDLETGDLVALNGMSALETLSIDNNDLADVGPLGSLSNLTTLRASRNALADLSTVPDSVTTLNANAQEVDLGQVTVGTPQPNPVRNVVGDPVALDDLYDSGSNTFTATSTGTDIVQWDDGDFAGTLTIEAISAADAVVIPDDNLRECVNDELGQGPNEAISQTQASTITSMDCSSTGGNGVTDFTGLDQLTSLTQLDLSDDAIDDVSGLAAMTWLEELNLEGNDIVDVAPLANLTSLTSLRLGYNDVAALAPITSLASLEVLSLHGNGIADVSALASMTGLTELDLSDNDITDVTPLAALTSVVSLNLSRNAITDISALPPYDYDTYYLIVRQQTVDLGDVEQGAPQDNPVVGSDGDPVALDDLYDASTNTFTATDLGAGALEWGGPDAPFAGTLEFTVVEAAGPDPDSGAEGGGASDEPDADQPGAPELAATGPETARMGLAAAASGLLLAGGLMVGRVRRAMRA